MPINIDLLIAAPMLQDYLVDKDSGFPLAAGIITMYEDSARTFLKNWYYQTGVPGAYTYIPLDNPLSLSIVGTIQDPNGNDVIPFYYPYDEDDETNPQPYYVTVYSVDSNGNPAELQFTRENFPFVAPGNISPTSLVPTYINYILNNIYWRNLGSLDCTSVTNQIIAPSQHEGYTNGDIRFIKSKTGATDTLTFAPMTATLQDDITPETMINMVCSAIETGETDKSIYYPIALHVDTLSSVQASVVIHAQNVSGSPNSFITLFIYQFAGTGAPDQPALIPFGDNGGVLSLNNNFQKFTITDFLPSSQGLTLGSGGDDALFLVVQYPLSSLFEINHTKPQIYLSEAVPDNDFDTYDQVEVIINSLRTGDIKITTNSFFNFGYIPMNNGTISLSNANTLSYCTLTGAQVWPLFNLLWNLGKPYDTGADFNPICQMIDATGADINYGSTAIDDFNANNQIFLTRSLGYVLAGTVPVSTLYNYKISLTGSDSGGNILFTYDGAVGQAILFNGQPIAFGASTSLPDSIIANNIYYISNVTSTTFNVSTTPANAYVGTVVAYVSTSGSGVYCYVNNTGSSTGEYGHIQALAELAAHTHTVGIAANTVSTGCATTANTPIGTFNTGSAGSSAAFNIVQPTTFYNVFIKL